MGHRRADTCRGRADGDFRDQSKRLAGKALDLLEGEGRVLRIKGKGTIVTKPKFGYEAADAAGRWF